MPIYNHRSLLEVKRSLHSVCVFLSVLIVVYSVVCLLIL